MRSSSSATNVHHTTIPPPPPYHHTTYISYPLTRALWCPLSLRSFPPSLHPSIHPSVDVVQENPSMRKVDFAEAKRYASSIGAVVVEASAKTGENVNEMFDQVRSSSLHHHFIIASSSHHHRITVFVMGYCVVGRWY